VRYNESMISQLFLQLTLPLMIAILIATLAVVLPGNKRPRETGRPPADTNRRLDSIDQRLDRLESELMKTILSVDHRLTVLEERSSLVRG
jgi:hypothetical protein